MHSPSQTPPALPDTPLTSADTSALWDYLRSRAGRVLLGALLGLVLAAGWLHLLASPSYRAMAVLVLDAPEGAVPDLGGASLPGLSAPDRFILTELEVLATRSLLAEVAGALDLAAVPEFAPTPGQGPLAALRGGLPDWARPVPGAAAERAMMLERLRSAITLRALPDTHVIEIIAESADPDRAAAIANTLVARYQARQVARQVGRADQAADWLTARVAELQADLDRAERAARAFEADRDLIRPDTPDILQGELASLRDRIAARAAALARQDSAAGRADLDHLRQQEAALTGRIAQVAQDGATLAQLRREAEAARLIYETFLADLKETRVQLSAQGPSSAVLSPADIPARPARPRPVLVLVLGALLGTSLALFAILRAALDRDTLRRPDEVTAALGLPCLGRVPTGRGRGRAGVLAHLARHPASALSEGVRQVRVGLRLGEVGGPRVVAVTSSVPAEGKTTLTLALARSAALLERRVLVIEGDVRRRSIAAALGRAGRDGGLQAAVDGTLSLAQAVRADRALGVDVLFVGAGAETAGDLVSEPGFAALIRAARSSYDVVLIDTPPVLVVPDARIVARYGDAVVFALRWDSTPVARAREALGLLAGTGRGGISVVLTRVDRRRQARIEGGTVDTRGYYRG